MLTSILLLVELHKVNVVTPECCTEVVNRVVQSEQ